jgi:hypothetical protein
MVAKVPFSRLAMGVISSEKPKGLIIKKNIEIYKTCFIFLTPNTKVVSNLGGGQEKELIDTPYRCR